MTLHYDAFISYRHCKPDSVIAQRIQYQLEHIKIPRGISSELKKKKISNVFRDKEELPLSANLSADIETALLASDYLIVICSPRTKESMWIDREIQTFLMHKPRENVLTVLVEGEPEDVVPAVLLEGQEPLCCDYRLPPGRAKRIELPRLAAAIVGCRYNDLRQRQKQQRRRKTVLAASLCFAFLLLMSIYFYSSARRIQASYDQSLISQSQFLSSSSLDMLESGDRFTAILLALQALPDEDRSRPWTSQAEYALGTACDLYADKSHINPVFRLEHSAPVDKIHFSPDKGSIVSMDTDGRCYVWSVSERELRACFPLENARDIVCGESCFYAEVNDALSCYSYSDARLLWRDSRRGECPVLSRDGRLLACRRYGEGLSIMDSGSGELIKNLFYDKNEDLSSLSEIAPLCFSPEGDRLCFSYRDDGAFGTDRLFGIGIYSLADEGIMLAPPEYGYSPDAVCTSEGRLVCYGYRGAEDLSMRIKDDALVLYTGTISFSCLSWDSAAADWSCTLESSGIDRKIPPSPFSCRGRYGGSFDALSVCIGSKAAILDCTDGSIAAMHEYPAEIVGVYADEEAIIFLSDGSIVDQDTESSYVIPFLSEVDFAAKSGAGFYTHAPDSVYIVNYSYEPERFNTVISEAELCALSGQSGDKQLYFSRDAAALCRELSMSTMEVRSFSPESGELLCSFRLPSGGNAAGVREDENILLYYPEDGSGIYEISLLSGEKTCLPMPGGDEMRLFDEPLFIGGSTYLLMAEKSGGKLHIFKTDGGPGEYSGCALPESNPVPYWGKDFIYPDANGRKILFLSAGGEVPQACILDIGSGECTKLSPPTPDRAEKHRSFCWSASGKLLLMQSENRLCVWDEKGRLIVEKDFGDMTAVSAAFSPEGEISVLFRDSRIHFYSPEGELLRQSRITDFVGGIPEYLPVRWLFYGDDCFVDVGGYCFLMNTHQPTVTAYIGSFRHYDAERNVIYSEYDDCSIVAYDRLSGQELIALARELAGGARLSEEQLNYYGLSE